MGNAAIQCRSSQVYNAVAYFSPQQYGTAGGDSTDQQVVGARRKLLGTEDAKNKKHDTGWVVQKEGGFLWEKRVSKCRASSGGDHDMQQQNVDKDLIPTTVQLSSPGPLK